jgi:hypothetical protein
MTLEIAMKRINDIKEVFDPTLFWDAREIDPVRHADYIIARVLDYGDEKDVKRLREIYGDDDLIRVVRTRRGLSPLTRRFWMVYFKLSAAGEERV